MNENKISESKAVPEMEQFLVTFSEELDKMNASSCVLYAKVTTLTYAPTEPQGDIVMVESPKYNGDIMSNLRSKLDYLHRLNNDIYESVRILSTVI